MVCITYSRLLYIHFEKTWASFLENRITFKIKTGLYIELTTRDTMKLLGSTKCELTKDKNGKNVPHLEISEVILVHYSIANSDYQQDFKSLVYICS